MAMFSVICRNCGVENWEAVQNPEILCPICADPRQYMDRDGQVWLSKSDLGKFSIKFRAIAEDAFALEVRPQVGIGHTSYLLDTGNGWLMWDPLPVVDENLSLLFQSCSRKHSFAVAGSHPHMYGAQSQWASAYNGTVYINEHDSAWVDAQNLDFQRWNDRIELGPRAVLVRIGGHFPGSSYLLWTTSDGTDWLFVSDTTQIRPNQQFSFMWSYPNLLPLGKLEVTNMLDRIPKTQASRAFDNFGRSTKGDIHQMIRKSAREHLVRVDS